MTGRLPDVVRQSRRRSRALAALALAGVATLLAGFVAVPAAQAATGPTVADPGARYSGISHPTSLQMAATGGTKPYAWTATGLPTGLGINATTGLISGTPTKAGTYAAKVVATDKTKLSGSVSFWWTAGVAPVVSSPGTRASVVGAAASVALSASGAKAPYVWSAVGLPPGLGIDASTGVISGTASGAGSFSVTVTATDAAKIPGSVAFGWDVAAAAVSVVDPGVQQGTVGQATTLTLAAKGGTGRYTWSATGLPSGLSLNAGTGVVSGRPSRAGSFSVTVTATDSVKRTGTATFTWITAAAVTVTNPGTRYSGVNQASSLQMAAAGGQTPYTWSATGLPTGLSINAATGLISGTPTKAGTSAAKVTATDPAKRAGSVSFSWTAGVAPVVSSPGTRASVVGAVVSLALSASGAKAPYVWSAVGLPVGVSINAKTGVISGTASGAGSYSVTVTATDAAKIPGSVAFTWDVAAAPVSVVDPGVQQGTVGQATTLALAAKGGTGPYTWSAAGLPAGLSLNAGTGVISGTPSSAGTATVAVTVTDSAKRTGAATFTWITATAPELADPGDQIGTVGVAVRTALTARGGTAPYAWSATGLPAGLTIDPAGYLSGIPAAAGDNTITVTVTDATGRTGTTTFTIAVTVAVSVADPGTRNGTVGAPTTVALGATGGSAPYTWSVSGLPDGLVLDPATGVISGTPTTEVSPTVVVTATDAAGRTGSASFAWQVGAAAPALDYAAAVADEADWISQAQVPPGHGAASGAISVNIPGGGIDSATDALVRPYLANLAVPGLVAAGPRYFPAAKAYLDWYLRHVQWPDPLGVYGTACDYRINVVTGVETTIDGNGNASEQCYYDSSDGYAGTFLMAMQAYARANPADAGWVADQGYLLESIANAIEATKQVDGLTWAKPDWHAKYLMDNVEAQQGFAALSWLERYVIKDAGKADYWAGEADVVAAAIEDHLYLPGVGMYANDTDATVVCRAGGTCPDWDTWYPNAGDDSTSAGQAWPLWARLGPAAQRGQVWADFTAHWPEWTAACPPSDASGTGCAGTPWAVLAYTAAVQGDRTGAATFVANARREWGGRGRPWPWTVADSGWLALAERALADGSPDLPAR
ncbi:putative Ig domain-containing protein [Krasilnikovia sp. MM14-A1259]|uniref:putative Ig domain-containing protein n=1 Tax=Krasilnikovia sp. MM14-A1259 TaxID=3373539 RepID=UPI00380F7D4E